MKKRYHTNHSRYQFSLNGASSNRSLRGSLKGGSRSVSEKLAHDLLGVDKLAKSNEGGMLSFGDLAKEEGFEVKLADEIAENELKGFAFGCIETLAGLAGSAKKDLIEALTALAKEKLTAFVSLVEESKEAKMEFKQYASWSRKFISSVQPLLEGATGPAQEVSQLTTQVMQCAECSMCHKYRSETLAKRVVYLEGAVAAYVAGAGMEMGFPEKLMGSVADQVKYALAGIAA